MTRYCIYCDMLVYEGEVEDEFPEDYCPYCESEGTTHELLE